MGAGPPQQRGATVKARCGRSLPTTRLEWVFEVIRIASSAWVSQRRVVRCGKVGGGVIGRGVSRM